MALVIKILNFETVEYTSDIFCNCNLGRQLIMQHYTTAERVQIDYETDRIITNALKKIYLHIKMHPQSTL